MKILKLNLMLIIFSSLFSIEISPPIEVSPDSIWAIWSWICVDSIGKIYVFWEQMDGIYFRYFEDDISSPPQKFFNEKPDEETGPVVDKYNRIWFFAKPDVVNIYGRYIYENELSPIIYVPVFPSCNIAPQIESDAKGNLWVAWTTHFWSHEPIFTRYYNGLKWSDTFSVCYLDSIKEIGSYTHRLFKDREGNMWILYETDLYDEKNPDTVIHSILLRKFENGKWGRHYIVNKENATNFGNITHTKSEYMVVFPRRVTIQWWPGLFKFELYALNFLDFSTTYLQKIWEEDSTPVAGVRSSLHVDEENRVWFLSPLLHPLPQGSHGLHLQLFDGKWSKPEIIELSDSSSKFYYCGSAYDRFRKRIWFTYNLMNKIYLRYIDISNVPATCDFTFLFFPNIIRNKNTTMISFMGVNEKDIVNIYVYDITGRKIKEIIRNLNNLPNFYRFYWTPDKFSSGNYFICIDTKKKKSFLKIILIK